MTLLQIKPEPEAAAFQTRGAPDTPGAGIPKDIEQEFLGHLCNSSSALTIKQT